MAVTAVTNENTFFPPPVPFIIPHDAFICVLYYLEYTDIKEENPNDGNNGGRSDDEFFSLHIILPVVFGPIIIAIIVFVIIIVIRKKGLCRNCKGGDDEYDSTELEAHKNIE